MPRTLFGLLGEEVVWEQVQRGVSDGVSVSGGTISHLENPFPEPMMAPVTQSWRQTVCSGSLLTLASRSPVGEKASS